VCIIGGSPSSANIGEGLREIMMGGEDSLCSHNAALTLRPENEKPVSGKESEILESQKSSVGENGENRPPETPVNTDSNLVALRFKRMRGVLRVLLTLPMGEVTTITINGKEFEFYVDESVQNGVSSMPLTHHYLVRGRESHRLYWFEQFAAIMTPTHVYFEFCGLSNGDVCVGVWETRCNRPFHSLLIYKRAKGECELFHTQDWRRIYRDVVFDPAMQFDMAEVEK
jgi:hypothetical protein